MGGAALRLLHQLSDCVVAAEALARASQPPLPLLRRAMAAWGLAGRVLALETLKRALVLINRYCMILKLLLRLFFYSRSVRAYISSSNLSSMR